MQCARNINLCTGNRLLKKFTGKKITTLQLPNTGGSAEFIKNVLFGARLLSNCPQKRTSAFHIHFNFSLLSILFHLPIFVADFIAIKDYQPSVTAIFAPRQVPSAFGKRAFVCTHESASQNLTTLMKTVSETTQTRLAEPILSGREEMIARRRSCLGGGVLEMTTSAIQQRVQLFGCIPRTQQKDNFHRTPYRPTRRANLIQFLTSLHITLS